MKPLRVLVYKDGKGRLRITRVDVGRTALAAGHTIRDHLDLDVYSDIVSRFEAGEVT